MATNPMLRQVAILLLSSLLLSGCGDSGVQQISGAPVPAPMATVNPRLITGVWGGYFPGSSLQKPDHGVEFHFDVPFRPDGSLLSGGFVHRPNNEGTRHDLTVERQGDQVTVTLGKGTPDEGVFRGQFVDSLTIQGTYTNGVRGESHPMKLIDSRSPEMQQLRPASKFERGAPVSPLAVDFSKAVTLRLDFTTSYGTDTNQHSVNFGFGPYYYETEQDWGTCEVVGGQDFCYVNPFTSDRTDYDSGISTVATMAFYPDWLLLEAWDPTVLPTERPIFSLELPWSSLLTLDGSKVASGSEATEAIVPNAFFSSEYCEVTRLNLSYIQTPLFSDYDALMFRPTWGAPLFRNVVIGDTVYPVPANTIKALEYLNFVLPFQQ